MKNMENKKADNEESLLEDNENFLSLEELSEDELPTFQEDVFGDMDKDFFNKRCDILRPLKVFCLAKNPRFARRTAS